MTFAVFAPCLPSVHVDLLKLNVSWAVALDFAGSFNAALTVEAALVTYCEIMYGAGGSQF